MNIHNPMYLLPTATTNGYRLLDNMRYGVVSDYHGLQCGVCGKKLNYGDDFDGVFACGRPLNKCPFEGAKLAQVTEVS